MAHDAPPLRIDVWSDFVCPFCYIADLRLQQLGRARPLRVIWHAFQLRPPGAPGVTPEKRAAIEASRPRLAAELRREFGVELRPGPVGTRTHAAHALHRYAVGNGRGEAMRAALMRAYWLEAQPIDAADVLRALALEAGLDADAPQRALDDETSMAAVERDMRLADGFGIGGVPTLIFGEQYLVQGAQPYAVFEHAAAMADGARAAGG
ncbi:DSBA oxidoreductase [Mizugakiibacter sediminis]|uniref:DSBA oxidoreductase n=1 Tax=Mizugakiibacter sediminis TaxID=1475481 RepID=A0A0K8QPS4_9GAMM|nr:DsbA family protein [Mizugakiibacter sediminis]GAP66671.1 DSBA oxidoreductase [Mizugakiibacter sediminis]